MVKALILSLAVGLTPKLLAKSVIPTYETWESSETLSSDNDETCLTPDDWDIWVNELDCFWTDSDEKWWYNSKISQARNTPEWTNWNAQQMQRFEDSYTQFDMAYYYDNGHEKVCLVGGSTLSMSKVRADTMVTNCTQPVAALQQPFATVRHHDMKQAVPATLVNYATVYDDKTRQSTSDASANGHPDWTYGQYVNSDHLPAKSVYMSSCNGGSSGNRLPTVAIMAIDHKGPVWSNCTTSRSTSSDNHRKTMALMKKYIENNEYGRAIFENLDCLLEASIYYALPESFTDYYWGFKNLVLLHYAANDINQQERDTLIAYLEAAYKDPYEEVYNTQYWDSLLVEQDTYLVPKFC